MDIAKAFTYVFDDENWIGKIGIGALISVASVFIIPLFLLIGWMVSITRNVIDGVEHPMPEWSDIGTFFKDGGILFLASLVYTSPFILVVCIAAVSTIGFGSLSEANEEVAIAGLFATFGLVACLGLILGLALFIITPAIVVQYVRTDNLAACFQFGQVFGIVRDNIGDVAITALTPFVANIGLSILLATFTAIPVIGWCGGPIISFALLPYIYAISGHMYGQLSLKIDGNKMGDFAV